VIPADPGLLARLFPAAYPARPEQVILFTVTAWDANCPQHIPQKVPASAVATTVAEYEARIQYLRDEIAELKSLGHAPQPIE
jgi:hypothetical protein